MTAQRSPSTPRVERVLAEIDALRIEKRIDKKSLSLRIGHGDGYFNHLLTGKITLTLQHVFDILDVLEVEPDAFFDRIFPSRIENRSGAAEEAFLKALDPDGILRLLVEKRLEATLQRRRDDDDDKDR
jgi:hypothetical protein